MTIKTIEDLAAAKAEVKRTRGVGVEALQPRDLFNPKLTRETKDVLLLDLRRRDCERAALAK